MCDLAGLVRKRTDEVDAASAGQLEGESLLYISYICQVVHHRSKLSYMSGCHLIDNRTDVLADARVGVLQ